MKKYFTIVICADDEHAARSLAPGEKIGPNVITACSMGDVITLSEQLKELIPSAKTRAVANLEHQSLAAFLP